MGEAAGGQLGSGLWPLWGCGFGHQDYELVAAISGYDIRTATVLMQNMSHTLEYDVAVQMAIKIIDEFEAVQVHQNHREGPASPPGGLPPAREHQRAEAKDLFPGRAGGACWLYPHRSGRISAVS